MRQTIIAATALGLVALLAGQTAGAALYTPERQWSHGHKLGTHPVDEPLATALPECLKANDPAAFQAYRKTGTYRTGGWWLPEPQTSNVGRCMREKGWLLAPKHIFSM